MDLSIISAKELSFQETPKMKKLYRKRVDDDDSLIKMAKEEHEIKIKIYKLKE